MNQDPYRTMFPPTQPGTTDATDAELAFWENMYIAAVATVGLSGDLARSWADKALQARRERFGRR